MSNLWEQVTKDAQLISLPAVYLNLKTVLDDPDYSMADVEAVLGKDPAMTARLLRQVNSPFFGFASRIDTVDRAIGMLGTQQVHDLVLATSVAQTFEGISVEVMDMHTFWWRSVYCGTAARLLAANCNFLDSERLFVAGLLRDIGHLVMYQSIPEFSQQAIIRAEEENQPLYRVERELIGFDFAKAGGALLQQWRLPQSLWEPVEQHMTPGEAVTYTLETAIIHLAGLLTESSDSETDYDALVSRVDPAAWQITRLTEEQYTDVRDEADQLIDDIMDLIFPHSKTVHAGTRLQGHSRI